MSVGRTEDEGGRTFDTLEELEAAAKRAWKQIPMDSVRRAIDRFRPRLEAVVAEDGGPIAHILG
jgi:hypothetical protein